MVCLSLFAFPFSRSRFIPALIGGAGIAGKSGIPVSGHFGNRGKTLETIAVTWFELFRHLAESREMPKHVPVFFPEKFICHTGAFRGKIALLWSVGGASHKQTLAPRGFKTSSPANYERWVL